MPEHTPRDGDAERLDNLLRRRAAVYSPRRAEPSYYGDDDIDLLRSMIAARDAALREKDAEIERLRSHVNSQSECIEARDRLIFGPREDAAQPEPATREGRDAG